MTQRRQNLELDPVPPSARELLSSFEGQFGRQAGFELAQLQVAGPDDDKRGGLGATGAIFPRENKHDVDPHPPEGGSDRQSSSGSNGVNPYHGFGEWTRQIQIVDQPNDDFTPGLTPTPPSGAATGEFYAAVAHIQSGDGRPFSPAARSEPLGYGHGYRDFSGFTDVQRQQMLNNMLTHPASHDGDADHEDEQRNNDDGDGDNVERSATR